jgi:hypothetical protein
MSVVFSPAGQSTQKRMKDPSRSTAAECRRPQPEQNVAVRSMIVLSGAAYPLNDRFRPGGYRERRSSADQRTRRASWRSRRVQHAAQLAPGIPANRAQFVRREVQPGAGLFFKGPISAQGGAIRPA